MKTFLWMWRRSTLSTRVFGLTWSLIYMFHFLHSCLWGGPAMEIWHRVKSYKNLYFERGNITIITSACAERTFWVCFTEKMKFHLNNTGINAIIEHFILTACCLLPTCGKKQSFSTGRVHTLLLHIREQLPLNKSKDLQSEEVKPALKLMLKNNSVDILYFSNSK